MSGINTGFFLSEGWKKTGGTGKGGGGGRIAIEGPELSDVNFVDILEVIKENPRRITLWELYK